jgi:hypothetical protein
VIRIRWNLNPNQYTGKRLFTITLSKACGAIG